MANSNSQGKNQETKKTPETEAQKEETKKTPEESRANIISAVKTPLTFFALVVLIVEGILGLVVGTSIGLDKTILIVGMISLIFLLVAVVAFMAFYRPYSLYGKTERPNYPSPHSEGISSDAEAYQILCSGYDERKNWGKVKQYSEAALRNDKKDANAWYFLGQAYQGMSNFNQAISSYNNSIKFGGPYSPSWIWYSLAWIYNQRGEYKLAEGSAKKALAIDQEYTDAWQELGHAYKNLGKLAESEKCYAKARITAH